MMEVHNMRNQLAAVLRLFVRVDLRTVVLPSVRGADRQG